MRWSVATWLALAACGGPGDDGPSDDADTDAVAVVAPVSIPLRRLTRDELARTVRDLLGVARDVTADLPADPATSGFDVVAGGLTVAPLHVEAWSDVAEQLAADVLAEPLPVTRALTMGDVEPQGSPNGDATGFLTSGPAGFLVDVRLPEAGTYAVRLHLRGGSDTTPTIRVTLGVLGAGVEEMLVEPSGTAERWLEVPLELPAGVSTVVASWEGTYDQSPGGSYTLDAVQVTGPTGVPPRPNAAWDRVVVCDPEVEADPRACVARVLRALAPRAWRRPVDDAELTPLLDLADAAIDAGLTPRDGLALALRAVLVSPHLLFLIEPAPPAGATGRVPVDPHALAARLSYALWSSMPDDALRARADDGTLTDPAVVAAEVHRMLADARADALVDRFAAQWLRFASLDAFHPDPTTFPAFDDDLRASMREALRREAGELLRDGRPLTALLDDTSAWVDPRLASFLGVDAPATWARVDLAAVGRVGWLTQPGWLAGTSAPARTSPVRRGAFVLDALLCDPPGAPPPDVPALEASTGAATLRDALAAHRADPACAGCHARIDPLGLALEHFDAVGAWRDLDDGVPVDATGRLPDGTEVDGAGELAAALLADDRFLRCATVRGLTWTLGRAPTADDEPLVQATLDRLRDGGGTLEALLVAVVTGESFLTREATP